MDTPARVLLPLAPVPTPGGSPGSAQFLTILGWVSWGALVICVAGVIFAGIAMIISSRRGRGRGTRRQAGDGPRRLRRGGRSVWLRDRSRLSISVPTGAAGCQGGVMSDVTEEDRQPAGPAGMMTAAVVRPSSWRSWSPCWSDGPRQEAP